MSEQKHMHLFNEAHATTRATYATIACVLLALAVLILGFAVDSLSKKLKDWPPMIIRANELGRGEAMRYYDASYKPNVREAQYYLEQFCRLYFSRQRETIATDLPDSLAFLSATLANQEEANWEKTRLIATFMNDQSQPEVKIDPVTTIVRSMPTDQSAGEAEVDLWKIVSRGGADELADHQLYTEHFTFVLVRPDKLPEAFIHVNPFGLVITSKDEKRDAYAKGGQ
jgi:hypothetical protein